MKNSELSIVLTGDDQIRKLNRIYRKKNQSTDVLAFSQREGESARSSGRLLGDVVLSVPTARRQAEARGQELLARGALDEARVVLAELLATVRPEPRLGEIRSLAAASWSASRNTTSAPCA